jgi:hypothetical protein
LSGSWAARVGAFSKADQHLHPGLDHTLLTSFACQFSIAKTQLLRKTPHGAVAVLGTTKGKGRQKARCVFFDNDALLFTFSPPVSTNHQSQSS